MIKENVNVILQDLPTTVRGFCIESPDGYHTIVLNARLNREQNVKSYEHELEHIRRDDFHASESVDQIELRAHGGNYES